MKVYANNAITAANPAYDCKEDWSTDRCHQTQDDQLYEIPKEDLTAEEAVYEYDYVDPHQLTSV